MPSVSRQQQKAMFAAAAGKSNLGIPQSVGAEFVKADTGGKLPKVKKYQGGGPVDRYDPSYVDPNAWEKHQLAVDKKNIRNEMMERGLWKNLPFAGGGPVNDPTKPNPANHRDYCKGGKV